jgi:hypothetical protein
MPVFPMFFNFLALRPIRAAFAGPNARIEPLSINVAARKTEPALRRGTKLYAFEALYLRELRAATGALRASK